MSSKFQVGDKVQIREWDDMENEFGLDFDGDINCRFTFTKNMKTYCGQTLIIKDMSYIYEYDDYSYHFSGISYKFSVDMFHKKQWEYGLIKQL